jgi:pSer/pThr/pTyr-binding forkhead associated (FHA) protein
MGGSAPGSAPGPAPQSQGWGRLTSVNRDGTDGASYPLDGEFVTIGRDASSQVTFEDDRFLARQHARIEYNAGDAKVVPLDTLNGVFKRLSVPIDLHDGDVLLVGREVLRFELVTEQEKKITPLVRHGVAMFGSPPREPWGRLRQLLPNGGEREVRYLDSDEFTIGREDGDMVMRDDAFLSRVHGAFRWQNGRAVFEDLQSSNGSFLRLREPTELRSGDHLRVGDQLFRFELG